ncbi:ABC transporter ATP-binding protein [Gemmatimonadota bacterium]
MQDMDLIVKIRLLAVLILGVETVKASARYFGGLLAQRLKIKIDRTLRLQCFNRLIQAGFSYLNKEQLARIFTVINNFTGHASSSILLLAKTVPDLVVSTVALAILFSISWQMTVVTMTIAVFTSMLVGKLVVRTRKLGYQLNRAAVKLNHVGFEVLNGLFLIRMFAKEEDMKRRFNEAVEEIQEKSYAMGLLESAVSPVAALLLVLVIVSLLIAATVIMNKEAEYWLEMLILFIVVFTRLGGPLSRVNQQRAQFASKVSAIYEVQNFIEQDDKYEIINGKRKFCGLKEGIEFDNISFRYDIDEEFVLNNVSLRFPKGSTTALVGGSGSGKSTLIALIARLYDPNSGKVSIDGSDLKEFDSSSWRRKIGVVSQNTFLFNDTMRSNISFGKPDASQEEIEKAARQANAHEFIIAMKDGYDTMLGDRGIRLSGGQAQRVAIARAILIEPEILLLDEATSALDTISERQVQKAIDQVSRNRTVIVVAHRLSTVRNADCIVVMEEGKVVEQGTHEQLLNARNKYWQYVELQNLYQVADMHSEIPQEQELALDEQEIIPDLPEMDDIKKIL